MASRVRVLVYPYLERAFARLSEWANVAAWRFAICPDCGRNRYTGTPCARGRS